MDPFNGNRRLEDHVMYSLEWAKFLRRDLDGQINPFLFEWKEEKQFVSMLDASSDPEEFGYKIAEQSDRGGDQFVLGYEAEIGDENGNRQKALMIKGYDKTQAKGVALFQQFKGKEDGGYEFIGKTTFFGNPDFPFDLPQGITPNYESEDPYVQGMALSGEDGTMNMVVITHENPALMASAAQRYVRSKIDGNDADFGGKIEFNIPPVEKAKDFATWVLQNCIEQELKSDLAKQWEQQSGKKLLINLSIGDDKIIQNFGKGGSSASSSKSAESASNSSSQGENNPVDEYKKKYQNFSGRLLEQEFMRIVRMPNARTNPDALMRVAALQAVAKEKGIDLEGRIRNSQKQSSGGCMSVVVALVAIGGIVTYFVI